MKLLMILTMAFSFVACSHTRERLAGHPDTDSNSRFAQKSSMYEMGGLRR